MSVGIHFTTSINIDFGTSNMALNVKYFMRSSSLFVPTAGCSLLLCSVQYFYFQPKTEESLDNQSLKYPKTTKANSRGEGKREKGTADAFIY